jgi:hypothetical protein
MPLRRISISDDDYMLSTSGNPSYFATQLSIRNSGILSSAFDSRSMRPGG